jgi:hypothetical protein
VPAPPQNAACPADHDLEGLVGLLGRLAEGRREVTVGEVADTVGAHGHGPLLLLMAGLLILPLGMIPGVGGALGLLMAMVGVQMLRGGTGVWLPGALRRRGLPAERLRAACARLRRPMRRVGRHLRPRLTVLAAHRVSLVVLATLLILGGLGLAVAGAIPILAPLVGLPLLFFALGLTAGDGRFVAAGYLMVLPPALAVALA